MGTSEDSARAALERRVTNLMDEAVRSGEVDEEALEAALRLQRLVEVARSVRPPPRHRWPVVAAVLLTLVIGSALAFGRTRSTEIELTARVDEVAFELAAEQVLFEGMLLSSLGVAGARRLELPNESVSGEAAMALRLEAVTEKGQRGSLRLGTLVGASGTRVRLQLAETPPGYRMTLSGPPSTLQIDLRGPVRIAGVRAGVATERYAVPRSVHVSWQDTPLTLALELETGPPGDPDAANALGTASFAPELDIAGLVLHGFDEHVRPAGTLLRRPSRIHSGRLYLDSLDGRMRTLRAGERLRFASSSGVLHRLRLGSEDMALRFHGDVAGMETGSSANPRSLMPSWLDWLRARQGLLLVWGSVLYVVGIVAAIARWMGLEP